MFKRVYKISQTDHWALCKICKGIGQIKRYRLIFWFKIESFLVKICYAALAVNKKLINLFYLNLIRLIRKVRLKDFIESNVKNLIVKNSRKNSTNIMKKVPKEVGMSTKLKIIKTPGQKWEMLVVYLGKDLNVRLAVLNFYKSHQTITLVVWHDDKVECAFPNPNGRHLYTTTCGIQTKCASEVRIPL